MVAERVYRSLYGNTQIEDRLTDHMSRREAEELLAAEAQRNQRLESALEEAERLMMMSRGCPAGRVCRLNQNGV